MNIIILPKDLKTIVKCNFFTFLNRSSAKETDSRLTQDMPLKSELVLLYELLLII